MPCDYVLDLERRRVLCRAWGVVTYDEAMATRRKFLSDPNFRPDFDQIYDGREVTRMAISASETGKLAMDAVFSQKSRRALVAPGGDTYDFGRMFRMYRSINAFKDQLRVFLTMEEAEAWLDN
jgi:hypothetical protein